MSSMTLQPSRGKRQWFGFVFVLPDLSTQFYQVAALCHTCFRCNIFWRKKHECGVIFLDTLPFLHFPFSPATTAPSVVMILMQVLSLCVYLLNVLWLLEMQYGLGLDVWTCDMMSYWLGHLQLAFSPSVCFVETWGSRYPETIFIWFSPVSKAIWCPFPVSLTTACLCRQNKDSPFYSGANWVPGSEMTFPGRQVAEAPAFWPSAHGVSTLHSFQDDGVGWGIAVRTRLLVWATTHLISVTARRVGESRPMRINQELHDCTSVTNSQPWLFLGIT